MGSETSGDWSDSLIEQRSLSKVGYSSAPLHPRPENPKKNWGGKKNCAFPAPSAQKKPNRTLSNPDPESRKKNFTKWSHHSTKALTNTGRYTALEKERILRRHLFTAWRVSDADERKEGVREETNPMRTTR